MLHVVHEVTIVDVDLRVRVLALLKLYVVIGINVSSLPVTHPVQEIPRVSVFISVNAGGLPSVVP